MKIKIKSLDINGQTYEQDFDLLKMVDLDKKKEYHYKDEHSNTKIVATDNSIEIYRHGEINSKQIFKESKKTSFSYITKEFKGKYEIVTKKLNIDNGKIIIKYDIISNSDIINTIDLEIVLRKEIK